MAISEQTNGSPIRRIDVSLGHRSYPIFIGSGTIQSTDIAKYVGGSRLLVVSNTAVEPLYLDVIRDRLDGKNVDSVILPDGEKFKNLDGLDLIFTALLRGGHDRKTTLIALGGGVVGDMTGFAAASYQRGVPFIQIPTTLLSQVDSSVGGKTGVNHRLGKNMIGAFYQPLAVVVDTDTLATLSEREFAAGLAEVIKYGLIADADFFVWLEDHLDQLLRRDAGALTYAIERSCQIKADVVAADETEQGVRAILNLGHTFGHAIETFLDYRDWVHGEAVSAGILMAAQLSSLLGHVPVADVERIQLMLLRCGLPITPPKAMQADDFKRLMQRDKKVLDGQMRLVILKSLGNAEVTVDVPQTHLRQLLTSVCGG